MARKGTRKGAMSRKGRQARPANRRSKKSTMTGGGEGKWWKFGLGKKPVTPPPSTSNRIVLMSNKEAEAMGLGPSRLPELKGNYLLAGPNQFNKGPNRMTVNNARKEGFSPMRTASFSVPATRRISSGNTSPVFLRSNTNPNELNAGFAYGTSPIGVTYQPRK